MNGFNILKGLRILSKYYTEDSNMDISWSEYELTVNPTDSPLIKRDAWNMVKAGWYQNMWDHGTDEEFNENHYDPKKEWVHD